MEGYLDFNKSRVGAKCEMMHVWLENRIALCNHRDTVRAHNGKRMPLSESASMGVLSNVVITIRTY